MNLKNKLKAAAVGVGLAALVATSANAVKLPKFFQNYKSKAKYTRDYLANIEGHLFYVKQYDIDGDKKADISELYPVLKRLDKTHFIISENALFYTVDMDRNGKIDKFEILVDPKMDGLNGNEKWYMEEKYGI